MPARSVCLVTSTLSLSEAGPGRFGGQVSVTDIYHTIPCKSLHHTIPALLTDSLFFYRSFSPLFTLPRTPFTEGCAEANKKAPPPPWPSQEQAPKQRCTFSPTT